MLDFFKEEAVYLFIALFLLGIVTFIATRDFVPLRPLKTVTIAAAILLGLIFVHYLYRMDHIKKVAKAFNAGKNILCVDKTNKIGYVLVHKGEWKLKEGEFIHPEFPRSYNIRQCVVE